MVLRTSKLMMSLFIAVTITLSSMAAKAAVLQEGWYKIMMGGQHIGFIVLRIEFDEKKKQFVSTSYTQTNSMGGGLKESLVATSSDKHEPVSYQYTSQVGKITKIIDAAFKNGVFTASVKEGEKNESVQVKLQKGTFLSQFLVYVILQSKQGFKIGNNFVYSAIAEEDAKAHNGEAYVSGMEKYKGIDAYKVLVTFKGTRFVNFVTPKGAILVTKDPTQSLSTEMVGSAEEATKGQDLPTKTLNALFKTLPGAGLPAATGGSAGTTTGTGSSAESTGAANSNAPAVKIDAGKAKKLGTPKQDLPKGISVPPGKNPGAESSPNAEPAPNGESAQ